jgi:hemerythrin-like domain-containing protein
MQTSAQKQAFEQWIAGPAAAGALLPAEELLAEHHVMAIVLAAMEAESQHLLAGRSLRPDFWSAVIDFNGNFVHMCHRVKEERHLIPALVEHRLLDAKLEHSVHQEHASGKELTLELCSGVEEADWEKVLRLVSIYAHVMRPHMRREEDSYFARAASLPPEVQDRLRRAFAEVDDTALGQDGRRRFVAVARRLATLAGVPHDLPADGA